MARFRKTRRIHFVGIGGIGMSGIAEVLIDQGYEVSGSDLKPGAVTHRLEGLGAAVRYGHEAGNVRGAHVVVRSSAVGEDNPEVRAAVDLGIPVIPRAEMLAELMRMKHGLAVAGTHGKTTTTSLLATCLAAAGLDPTVVVGGRIKALGTNARLGQGEYLVAEADESDGSFLRLSPTIAVVTNIDPEHLDHYGDFEAAKDAFLRFVDRVPFYGAAVLCLDHPVIQDMLPRVRKRAITYGLASQADFRATSIGHSGTESTFTAHRRGEVLGDVRLAMPGRHNVLNALATIAVCDELDVPWETVRSALSEFGGVGRRFEVKGVRRGVTVVDDYAHHPEEIRATLRAARDGFPGRLVAVFQPHRYSRVRDLFAEFVRAFNDADLLYVTPIYAAGEAPIPGIDADALWRGLREHGHKTAGLANGRGDLVREVAAAARPGDVVISLGAGDITTFGDELLGALGPPAGE